MIIPKRLGENMGYPGVELLWKAGSDDVWGVCVYRRQLPSAGRRVLRIVVTGERNPRAKDCHVHVDGIRAEP